MNLIKDKSELIVNAKFKVSFIMYNNKRTQEL